MTTTMATKGQVVIPKTLRDKMKLEPGDDFEIYEIDGEVILRPLPKQPNEGLMAILMNPPGPLDIPERERDLVSASLDFS